jgi:hypothetical protein
MRRSLAVPRRRGTHRRYNVRMSKRLFLIDGTALAYRSFFAFQGTGRAPLTTAAGHPTAATYGFCMTLRALLEREKPDAIAISFDGPRSDLVRTRVYADYKSTRSKMPDEMKVQLDDIHEATLGFGIPIVDSETHEADDVIGTLAVRGRDAGMEVFIVTGDKDFLQIVDDHVKLWNLRSSTSKPDIIDAESALAKWGVPTTAMVDLLALMGDTSGSRAAAAVRFARRDPRAHGRGQEGIDPAVARGEPRDGAVVEAARDAAARRAAAGRRDRAAAAGARPREAAPVVPAARVQEPARPAREPAEARSERRCAL